MTIQYTAQNILKKDEVHDSNKKNNDNINNRLAQKISKRIKNHKGNRRMKAGASPLKHKRNYKSS